MKICTNMFMICFVLACNSSRNSTLIENESLYDRVFCLMQKVKLDFKTPNNSRSDSIYIYEKYFIDSTSVYYNRYNVGFYHNFIVQNTGTEEQWKFYSYLNKLTKSINEHNIKFSCYKYLKIEFVSDEEIYSEKLKSKIFVYSPLIKKLNGDYIIYEHDYNGSEYYYGYIFRLIEDEIKFIDREFYTNGYFDVTDYIGTVNFKQPYYNYIKSLH